MNDIPDNGTDKFEIRHDVNDYGDDVWDVYEQYYDENGRPYDSEYLDTFFTLDDAKKEVEKLEEILQAKIDNMGEGFQQ